MDFNIFDKAQGIVEQELVRAIIRGLPDDAIIVEVGTGRDATFTKVMAECCVTTHRHIYTIECGSYAFNWKCSEEELFEAIKENLKHYSNYITIINNESTKVAETFGKKADLIFLDGDHSFEGVRADILAWDPHLKTGGFLVGHDFHAVGVYPAIGTVLLETTPKRYMPWLVARSVWSIRKIKPGDSEGNWTHTMNK